MVIAIMFAVCIALNLMAMLGTGSVAEDVVKAQEDIQKLKLQIESVRETAESKDLLIDGQSLEIAELKAKNEQMKAELIDLSNKYTRAKRDIEMLASDAVRNGGVKWAKQYEVEDET